MEEIKILALGGLDENGKNLYIIEIDEDIYVLECGLKLPDPKEQLGVEYIIPDFSYILKNKERVRGIFITHGHDDVMLALPHLLKEYPFDVYTTAFTSKLIEIELKKFKLKNKIKIINRNQTFKVKNRKVTTFPLMSQTADGIGIAIDSEHGAIVYTSEFIFDYDSLNKHFAGDVNALSILGNNGVFCLLNESLGTSKDGYTSPHHKITKHLENHIELNENRTIITLYKQNLYRVIEVLELAQKYKKRVYFYDQELYKQLKILDELGYRAINKNTIIEPKDFNNDDVENVIVIVSASGNSVFQLMRKIALGGDSSIELKSSDCVLIASPVVPGTEKEAAKMEDDLYKANVEIHKVSAKEVYGMHASKEDLKMMIYMLKPKYYLPIKGDYRHLIENANIALSMGYTADKIIILDNGQVACFKQGRIRSTKEVLKLEDSLIDGKDRLDIGGIILRDRETLSTDGAIIIGVALNFKTKKVICGPDIQSRGVIYLKDAEHIIEEITNILTTTIETALNEKRYENMAVRMEVKEKVTKYLLKETGKRPMVLPTIIEINVEEEDE